MADLSANLATIEFTRTPHPAPVPGDMRAEAIADPRFGTVFTDHMVVIDYDADRGGWHRAQRVDPTGSRSHGWPDFQNP